MDKLPEDLEKDLFGFEAPSEDQLNSISVWASKAIELQAEIDQIEEYLKVLNKTLSMIEEVELPNALLAANMLEFKMVDGGKITIRDVIQGSFSKDPTIRQFIFDWVIKAGGQEIIKDHFEVNYTRGQYKDAVELRHLLQDNHINFDEFENIHTGTLQAFLHEKIRENTMPPFDKMGFRYFKKADIKVPKKED
jgi:hypothetical protein